MNLNFIFNRISNRRLSKKSQASLLVTILLLLMVIASVAIIWNVVRSTILGSEEQTSGQFACMNAQMEVSYFNATENKLTVRRSQGDSKINVTGCRIFVEKNGFENEIESCTRSFMPLDTEEITISSGISSGNRVRVVSVIGETVCAPGRTFRVK
ncbi:hypothetical protein GF386_05835 [Candidatus Pacearchaeota archaeon]|nr:hypothetical protein [Candidatus Pacearchaeota archaeon]MBD3283614.1 hypothetical protein [Candidatus Pacearchaeota archaeon]